MRTAVCWQHGARYPYWVLVPILGLGTHTVGSMGLCTHTTNTGRRRVFSYSMKLLGTGMTIWVLGHGKGVVPERSLPCSSAKGLR